MKKATDKQTETDIEIKPIERRTATFYILGLTPLIMNRQSEKAKRDLLLPKKKSKGDRETTLKHEPMREFRDAANRYRDDDRPTRCFLPAPAFKKGIMTAALDLPGGATKAGVGRHLTVLGESVDVYGVPRMRADMVRMAGMNKTPDVRFRPEFPEWCCQIRIQWAALGLTETSVTNLLAGAGFICGVGDYRQEKGAGEYGQFRVIGIGDEDWATFERIRNSGGLAAQDAAFANPEMTADAQELVEWFDAEIDRRGRKSELDKSVAQEKADAIAAKELRKGKNGKGKEAH